MIREKGLQEIERTRIIAIVRGVEEQHIAFVAEALLQGGVTVMEITLNTPGALSMISRLQDKLGDQMYIGAGTVLDLDDAKRAIDAGAAFIVTPNTDEEVIRFAHSQQIPIFPGALTPTEIVKAWKAGATAVKVFPSASLGLTYIKELMGLLSYSYDGRGRSYGREYSRIFANRLLWFRHWRLSDSSPINSSWQLCLDR